MIILWRVHGSGEFSFHYSVGLNGMLVTLLLDLFFEWVTWKPCTKPRMDGIYVFFALNKLQILQKSDSNSSQSLKWWRISFSWREWPGNFKVRYDQNPGYLLYMGNETLPCYNIGIVSNYKNPYEAISTSWNAIRVLNVVSYWSLFLSSQAKKKCAAHWQSRAFWW